MTTTLRNLVSSAVLLALLSSAHALTIVRTNDASMSNTAIISPADAASASAAFDYAAGQIMALYSDPVRINITLAATTDPAVLGQSTAPLIGTFSYAQIRTLLINDNNAHPSADGTTSTAALPAADPYSCSTFLVARALAKALGNIPSDTTNDGTFTFGTSFSYTYDPLNRAVAGKHDFIGVAFHEITEVMGRVARLNSSGNCNRPYDVFRFTGAGVQSLTFTDANVYFSVNGGSANLKTFNANGNGGDLGDWASGTNDAFNAFSSSGVQNDLTPVDVRVMDVIGYDLGSTGETISTPTTPSGPSSGSPGVSYTYATGGSSSNLGHPVQYQFDWGDGSVSGWLPVGTTSASHSWSSSGTYSVRAQARCATHTSITSNLSGARSVSIGSPTPTPPCGPVTISGSITTSDPTQTNRPNRGGTPSSCGVPNSCSVLAGTFHYRAHTFVNTSGTQQCVTATLTTSCSGANFIFAAAYLNSFNPASICTNYVGDPGSSPNGAPVSFGFNVPAGATFTIVVSEVTANSGCSGYTLDVAGLSCGGPTPTTLANISTRLRVETGDNVLIGGFIITGTQGKRVMLRAIGPSLPVAGALSDPVLELRNSSGGLIASNDDWRFRPDGSSQQAEIEATGIPPTNILESALVTTLPANNSAYTAKVYGYNGATGIGLVEAYDLDRTVNSKLANISTRGLVTTGDNVMIGGTIIIGSNQARVLFRAIGPSLTNLGVPNALSDTTLELRDGNGNLIAFNDDWRFRPDGSSQQAEIEATGIPPTNFLESALVQNLAPASYTAIVRGYNDLTGVALVEAYQLQ